MTSSRVTIFCRVEVKHRPRPRRATPPTHAHTLIRPGRCLPPPPPPYRVVSRPHPTCAWGPHGSGPSLFLDGMPLSALTVTSFRKRAEPSLRLLARRRRGIKNSALTSLTGWGRAAWVPHVIVRRIECNRRHNRQVGAATGFGRLSRYCKKNLRRVPRVVWTRSMDSVMYSCGFLLLKLRLVPLYKQGSVFVTIFKLTLYAAKPIK